MIQPKIAQADVATPFYSTDSVLFLIYIHENLGIGTTSSSGTGCLDCWTAADVDDYHNWVPKAVFSEKALQHRLASEPFKFNPDTKFCDLQCDTGYWSNAGMKDSNDNPVPVADYKYIFLGPWGRLAL